MGVSGVWQPAYKKPALEPQGANAVHRIGSTPHGGSVADDGGTSRRSGETRWGAASTGCSWRRTTRVGNAPVMGNASLHAWRLPDFLRACRKEAHLCSVSQLSVQSWRSQRRVVPVPLAKYLDRKQLEDPSRQRYACLAHQ